MKPTTPSAEKIDSVIEELRFVRSCLIRRQMEANASIVEDAIALIQSLRQSQQGEPSAWIRLSERQPTKEDGDVHGEVLGQWPNGRRVVVKWNHFQDMDCTAATHWQRLPAPPIPELTAEQKQIQEDEKAWNIWASTPTPTGCATRRDSFLAGRQSQRSQGGAK